MAALTTEQISKMTKDERAAKMIETFLRIGKAWNVGRQGIITSFNGVRVGSWKWDTNRMVIQSVDNSSGKEFKAVLKTLQEDQVMVTAVPTGKKKKDEPNPDILYRTIPLSKVSPGELDIIMRENGYFIIDANIPVTAEGVEGAALPNPQNEV